MNPFSFQLPETIEIFNYTFLVNPATLLVAMGIPFLWLVCLWAWFSTSPSNATEKQSSSLSLTIREFARRLNPRKRHQTSAYEAGYEDEYQNPYETNQEIRFFKFDTTDEEQIEEQIDAVQVDEAQINEAQIDQALQTQAIVQTYSLESGRQTSKNEQLYDYPLDEFYNVPEATKRTQHRNIHSQYHREANSPSSVKENRFAL